MAILDTWWRFTTPDLDARHLCPEESIISHMNRDSIHLISKAYCWWKKPCTSWQRVYLTTGVFAVQVISRILPSTVGPTDVGEDPYEEVSLPNQADKLHPPWVLRCSNETRDVTYSFQVRLVLMLWKTHLFHPWKWTWNTIMNCLQDYFPFQFGDFWVPAVDISGGIHWYHHPWSRIATSRDWWGTKPKRNGDISRN